VSNPRQKLGRWGEDLATRHLQAADYAIVERNYRCTAGEMDIVTRLGDEWVFVEVKTRRGDSFGLPEDAITPAKAARLLRVAESYLQEHGLLDVDWRVDLIAVELDTKGKLLRVEQITDAVTGW
jgi:putative endonuclease